MLLFISKIFCEAEKSRTEVGFKIKTKIKKKEKVSPVVGDNSHFWSIRFHWDILIDQIHMSHYGI